MYCVPCIEGQLLVIKEMNHESNVFCPGIAADLDHGGGRWSNNLIL